MHFIQYIFNIFIYHYLPPAPPMPPPCLPSNLISSFFVVVMDNPQVRFTLPLHGCGTIHFVGNPISVQCRVTTWEVFEHPCTQAQPQKLIQ